MSGNRGKGKCIAFIRALIGHEGDDCIPWPYSRDPQGRGLLGYLGETWQAHRLICIMVNGDPPTPTHHAAHTCGQGHNACVNPNHVVWKTPQENAQDMVVHGTAKKAGMPRARLTAEQVAVIKELKGRKTQREIAAMFGVAWETIADIHRGRTWTGVRKENRKAPPQVQHLRAELAPRLRKEGKTFSEIGEILGVTRGMARIYVETKAS